MNRLKQKIKFLLSFKKPYALTFEEWDDWNSKTRANHPIKWFVCETIPDLFKVHVWWPITKIVVDKWYWGFKYRFIPKHQYHIIKPKTLEPAYHNEYDLILHASFHVLTEFVEYEEKEGIVDWRGTPEHSEFWDEAHRLVYWWKHIRPYREDWLERDYPYPDGPIGSKKMWVLYDKYKHTDEYKEWSRISKIRQKYEKQFEIDDESYLIRLTKIRMFLWN